MLHFLETVAAHIKQNHAAQLSSLCVVLPNKRGGLYLKKHLSHLLEKPSWIPDIISTEELITRLSGLSTASDLTLTFYLYDAYVSVTADKAAGFEQFLRWAPQVLQDFNEIDRYLVNHETVFTNLREIKEIESWSLSQEKLSRAQENYLAFMQRLGQVYALLKEKCLAENTGWQGLAYRRAYENVLKGKTLPYKKILLCGFNALNLAEEKIIKQLLENRQAEILWDADSYYLDDDAQEAGTFLRRYIPYFKSESYISHSLSGDEKKITVTGVAGRMAQVAAATQSLNGLLKNNADLQRTAIVLSDESLLIPLLSVLPEEVQSVNITLEYPTHITPLFALYEQLLNMRINKKENKEDAFYFKDVLGVLYNPVIASLFSKELHAVTRRINKGNIIYLRSGFLQSLFADEFSLLNELFSPQATALEFIASLCSFNRQIIETLRAKRQKSLESETAILFQKSLNVLRQSLEAYPETTFRALRSLLNQTLAQSGIPFYGEPLSGLQVMGVLETRTLDFDNVIMLSVNEGVLPSGRSDASFIPDDLKRFLQMPLHGEKDAIYAYHFYRLLQRSKNISLIYNTETDTFGKGEKSRFITQLLSEIRQKNRHISITADVVSIPVSPAAGGFKPLVTKTDAVLAGLLEKASSQKGLSPTALNTYKECALKFYYRFIANIREPEEVDEGMEAAAVGDIIHKALEKLYKPFTGKPLVQADIEVMKNTYASVAEEVFAAEYAEAINDNGKRAIALHVIKKYIHNLLLAEKQFIEELAARRETVTIKKLEETLFATLTIHANGMDTPVTLSGTIDRVDETPSAFRIIDYKSSVKKGYDKFDLAHIEDTFTDVAYNKVLQLLTYAWLAWKNGLAPAEKIKPFILPFRAEEKLYGITFNKQPLALSDEFMMEFEKRLARFIASMFDASADFSPVETLETCLLCAYRRICNRG